MPDTWGRECKLGWGYNEDLRTLITVEGESKVTPETKNQWWYHVWNISSTDIEYWVSFLLGY